jgi:hypothetical protein
METLSQALAFLAKRAAEPSGWKDAHDIISGFRGPDVVPDTMTDNRIKWLTTARIRAILFRMVPEDAPELEGSVGCYFYHYGIMVRANPLSEEEMKERDDALPYLAVHFRGHYTKAVQAVRRTYNYCLEHERSSCREHLDGTEEAPLIPATRYRT